MPQTDLGHNLDAGNEVPEGTRDAPADGRDEPADGLDAPGVALAAPEGAHDALVLVAVGAHKVPERVEAVAHNLP